MKVLSVTSELYPLIKTGGLADVAGALPAALAEHGIEVRTLVPGYPAVLKALEKPQSIHDFSSLYGGTAQLLMGRAAGLDIIALDAPHLFNRPGNPYLGTDGKDWPDNASRFAALSQAAADIGNGIIPSFTPDLLHLHDWQAALAAALTRYNGGPPTLLTIHNIAFQGQFPATVFPGLGLPPAAFSIDGVEYYGQVSFLKGGIASATAISTVSPTYAMEICSPEFGMGLDGLLRARRKDLTGIVNGIDTTVWNPATDAALAQTYDATTLAKRTSNKRALERKFGLDQDDGILHGVVSRLTGQKGLDVFAASLDWLVSTGARAAIVGAGDPAIENAIRAAVQRHKGRIGAFFGYSEQDSHVIQGGADTMLVPSRFEPCGLTQIYGLRYGCVPVVARTGGLADTVIDANDAALSNGVATGIQFSGVTEDVLQAALSRASSLYAKPQLWSAMQKCGMNQDVSWNRSAAAYVNLYRSMIAG